MKLTIHGKQLDVGDALRTHITDKLEELNEKYFNHATDATVTMSHEGHGHGIFKAHISVRIGKDIMVMADARAVDPYAAFDSACEKVAKQMRRYKKRLRDHHRRLEETPETQSLKARDYVLATEPDESEPDQPGAPNSQVDDGVPQGSDPVVIAEMETDIQTLSVSEAVMRMDLAGQSALLFRNASHNGLNMVYRRPDGNVGWMDPDGNEKTSAA